MNQSNNIPFVAAVGDKVSVFVQTDEGERVKVKVGDEFAVTRRHSVVTGADPTTATVTTTATVEVTGVPESSALVLVWPGAMKSAKEFGVAANLADRGVVLVTYGNVAEQYPRAGGGNVYVLSKLSTWDGSPVVFSFSEELTFV
jgi:hypothetical protein